MHLVAAARQFWARRRLQRPKGVVAPATAKKGAGSPTRLARIAFFSQVALAVMIFACAAIGMARTQEHARNSTAEQHAALRMALDELRDTSGDLDRFNPAQLRFLRQQSGLQDLRFGLDPVRGGRAIQSVEDAQGRIVGWFSWAPDRRFLPLMDWLFGLAIAVAVALLVCAVLARRAAGRLAGLLADAVEAARKSRSEDPLTGLPNQRAMLDNLERALGAAKESAGKRVVFARLEIEGLREVKDALGRRAGDVALVDIAKRLVACLPPGAVLGRLEDNEFAGIATGNDDNAAYAFGETLRAALSEPFAFATAVAARRSDRQDVPDHLWRIDACIGVVEAPVDGSVAEDLLRRAALALRAAKRDGRGAVHRFAPQIEAERADRRFLLRELRAAVRQQNFDVLYQPIVAADGAGIVGVEALVRWIHPERGAIAPSVFIPLAEQNGLMGELGEIVLRRALADGVRWPQIFVAVNISPVQVRDPHLVDLVAAALSAARIAPDRVVLEMTEGILIDDPEQTRIRLDALRALGVSIALDDFGTGYSSLSYLQKFPFQRLKIDRAFVASLGDIGNAGAIIQSIVTLGHALGMSVLAEGIETDEQRVLLRLAGCDEMQGFLFARPSPAEAIDRLLVQRSGHSVAQGRRAATR